MNLFFEHILNLFFPPRCVFCQRLCRSNRSVCCECEAYKTPNGLKHLSTMHDICFSFDGCTSPYYYAGTVRKAMGAFKFHGKIDLAHGFAKLMAEKVHDIYSSIAFDYIVYVPLNQNSLNQRKYDQSELLAKYASKELKIPLLCDTLTKDNSCKIQHHLNFDERWRNTQNAYRISDSFDNEKIKGKTLLLIDDICTTGATLNSCSKVLKAAGAGQVYCATVAVSKYTNSI